MAVAQNYTQSTFSKISQKFPVSLPALSMEGPQQKYVLFTAVETTGISKFRAVILAAPAITDNVGPSVFLGTYSEPNKFASFMLPATGTIGDVVTIPLFPGTRELAEDDVLILSTTTGRRFGGAYSFQVTLNLFE